MSFEVIPNHHPTKTDGRLRPSSVLSLLIQRTLLAIFVFLPIAEQWAMAQETGLIQGTVTDSSGAAIFGAVVAVEGADGNRSTTVTDVEGSFKISSLAAA